MSSEDLLKEVDEGMLDILVFGENNVCHVLHVLIANLVLRQINGYII
jgi:hypothetical protein